MFYFAYAANMNHQKMLKELCVGAKFIGPAVLNEYGIFFDGFSPLWGGAVLNIEQTTEDEVWGGVFEITEDHLRSLDGDEGCPKYYARKEVMVELSDAHTKLKAWIYYRDAYPTGKPSRTYIHAIMKGTKDCGLPEDYVNAAFGRDLRVLDQRGKG